MDDEQQQQQQHQQQTPPEKPADKPVRVIPNVPIKDRTRLNEGVAEPPKGNTKPKSDGE